MSTVDVLQRALAAEHAAVWAYGLIGGQLVNTARQQLATDCLGAHATRRDALIATLTARKATPVQAEPGYEVPQPVRDPASAYALAVHVEEGVAAAWRAVLAGTAERQVRQTGLAALTDASNRAVAWRNAAGKTPVTVPLPGIAP
jgi:Domain of unknown function (DUF4439)